MAIWTAPVKGMHASDLVGANVKAVDGESVGSVDNLIIDQSGHVVAIVHGVGGFPGMGDKEVAIGWDHITLSGQPANRELSVDVTRKDIGSAPKLEKRN